VNTEHDTTGIDISKSDMEVTSIAERRHLSIMWKRHRRILSRGINCGTSKRIFAEHLTISFKFLRRLHLWLPLTCMMGPRAICPTCFKKLSIRSTAQTISNRPSASAAFFSRSLSYHTFSSGKFLENDTRDASRDARRAAHFVWKP
jgi:hypothetical protein